MDYLLLKSIHVTAVALSGLGFAARGIGRLMDAGWVRSRAARSLPHAVDSVLLASAIALAVALHLSPLTSPWLLAKICGLLLYIGLGMVALRYGPTRSVRTAAWLAALLVFAYIVTVAMSKSPLGPFAAADLVQAASRPSR